ncbi:MAG: hypothetical protein U0892_17595 [Pirellulales bacterium]
MLRRIVRSWLLSGLIGVSALAWQSASAASPEFSHKQSKVLVPAENGQSLPLHTFGLGPDGNLWMCCTGTGGEGKAGRIVIMQPTGESVRTISLEFAPTAINFSADGIPYVAGSGKIARLTKTGEVDEVITAPNLLNEEELKKRLEESAKKQVDQMVAVYDEQVKRLEEQVTKLAEQAKDESADEKTRKRAETRLKVLEKQRDVMKEQSKEMRRTYAEYYSGAASMERVKRATGIAVSKKDIFVSLPSLEGFGYAIWRMDHNLKNAVVVKENVGGCCGQLDIQTDGTDILVAENTAFKVGRFDRDGKELISFGERMREGDAGWGSCCNPMNIRCVEGNEILTAESSIGHIKRYSKDGKYLGLVGTARIGGGCKHVALAVDKQRDWYYMMNQGGNNVVVLVPKSEAPGETEEEKSARIAREGLGKKLVGAWEAAPVKAAPAESADPNTVSLDTYIRQQYPFLHFHLDGHFENTRPVAKDAANKANAGTGGLLGAVQGLVQSVTGNSESTAVALVEARNMNWEPISQTDETLQFFIVDAGVRGFGAVAKFVGDDELELQWFYDSPASSYGKLTYKRIPGECCTSDKPCTTCAGKCDEKPAAAAEKTLQAERKPETSAVPIKKIKQ